jgi:hypothetical protein
VFPVSASLESRSKPTAADTGNKTQKPENLNNITEEAIENLETRLEGNDNIKVETKLINSSSAENNVVVGDKNSKRSKVMNVNVIVLKSKYSQILHEYFSKKYDPNTNRSRYENTSDTMTNKLLYIYIYIYPNNVFYLLFTVILIPTSRSQ